ncbi:unnamed protein product [Clavelina lepadiformis]|uniref:T-box domain-containing protein n=1 Tax=Clavelina lepadiformis TaxID=159417 RepID=A0ABP0G4R0_CLALP
MDSNYPSGMQVDKVLKAISDLILQELKSMRQDIKMEFSKMQENMEDMCLKLLAETRKAETMNNSGQVENTMQPLTVQSDTGICIQEVYSEKTSVIPHLEAIKVKSLLPLCKETFLTESDDAITPMLNNIVPQSENEGNAPYNEKIVDSESSDESTSHEEHNRLSKQLSIFPHLEEDSLSLQDWKVSQFETGDKISPLINNVVSQSENEGNAVYEENIVDSENINERIPPVNCEVSPILQTETDGTTASLSYNIVLQSENEANTTVEDEIVDSENLTERNSHDEYNMSAKELSDKNTVNGESNKAAFITVSLYQDPAVSDLKVNLNPNARSFKNKRLRSSRSLPELLSFHSDENSGDVSLIRKEKNCGGWLDEKSWNELDAFLGTEKSITEEEKANIDVYLNDFDFGLF